MVKSLLVEDDVEAAQHIAITFGEEGHQTVVAGNGRDGLREAQSGDFDLLVVDRMLPDLDGLTLVAKLRAGRIDTPVLFLTAMSGLQDRVTGLHAGGDDYLIKPFEFVELLARVTALGRRPRRLAVETTLQAADLVVDVLRRRGQPARREILLPPRHLRIPGYFTLNPHNTVT